MQLNNRDRRILALLQQDCRISNADLAQKVGMSASACWRRVRAFEEAGIIARYGAVLNPDKVGLEFEAIVLVQLTRHDPDNLAELVRVIEMRPEVLECFATTGQADYHMHVLFADIATYNDFLENVLFRLPAVASAQTNVVLRKIKRAAVISP
ncbi:DNA-binding transcriptional regulator, Lrp family [Shimia gijangensis]|uniref:DNA-binding transcriptional regulator, Lrp family n=1 Tax=Shimia gijangensis TaxID=1470563 RepID=A0A1M6I767_9RHOB|nr:Lrp/AsnC family transcriptional regulator [Shimia gijangensis]SHJ30307.1 DNA-binding transcriptional regulator, Lrp family [Shimia gijangensis]